MPKDDEILNEEEQEENEEELSENLGMRERDNESVISEKEDSEEKEISNEENSEELDDSFEDYQSEEEFAREDGVFYKKDDSGERVIDERAQKAYRDKANDFSDAEVIDREQLDEYIKSGKRNGKKLVVNDKRFSAGIDSGFTEAEQFKFGWRDKDSTAKIVVRDKILPQFDPEHKFVSVMKMIAVPVTVPARGIWAGIKAIGRGFAAAGRWLGETLGIVEPKHSSQIELIGEKLEYEDSDRSVGNLTTDMKKEKVTPDMVRNSVLNRASLEHLSDGKKLSESLIDGTVKQNYADALKEERNNMLAHVFGKGNPLSAYECVLDKKALKQGIYKFDDKVANKFLNALSDEKLERTAEKTINGVKKSYFKQYGGERSYIEQKERENAEKNKEEVKQEVVSEQKDEQKVEQKVEATVKEPIEVPEAKDNAELNMENKQEEKVQEKQEVIEVQQEEMNKS